MIYPKHSKHLPAFSVYDMDQSSGSSSSRHLPFGGPGARTILDDEPGPSSLPDSQGYPENMYESHPDGAQQLSQQSRDTHTASPSLDGPPIKRVGGKANVSSACGPCKRAHLACDIGRPCKRCINMGKQDQCEDVPVSLVFLLISRRSLSTLPLVSY